MQLSTLCRFFSYWYKAAKTLLQSINRDPGQPPCTDVHVSPVQGPPSSLPQTPIEFSANFFLFRV